MGYLILDFAFNQNRLYINSFVGGLHIAPSARENKSDKVIGFTELLNDFI
jgi:hypothetical protein